MSSSGGAVRVAGRAVPTRHVAGIVIAFGVVAALIASWIALTSDGVAFGIFIGVVVMACLVSCVVAWRLSERALHDVDEQLQQLTRHRDGSTTDPSS